MLKKKIVFFTIFLAIASLATVGFIYPKFTLSFTPEASGKLIMDIGIDRKLAPLLEHEIKKTTGKNFKESLKFYLPAKAKLKTYPVNNVLHYQIEIAFKNPAELETLLTKKPTLKTPLTKEDEIYFTDYTFKQKINLDYRKIPPPNLFPQASQVLASTKIYFELILPGEIIASNGKVAPPSTVSWELKLGKKYTLFANSRLIRWRLVIATGTLLTVIIGWLGALIIYERARQTKNR